MQIVSKCQILFPDKKNKKNISKCRLLKILPRVLSFNKASAFAVFQLEAFKRQHMQPEEKPAEEEDVPPPPSPPKGKPVVLPPNWKTAKDAEGKMYYYHTVTR